MNSTGWYYKWSIKTPSVVALSNWAFEGNVSLTVCSDFPSLLTKRLVLTPGKLSVKADIISESDTSNGTHRFTALCCSFMSLALRTDESPPKSSAFHPCKIQLASYGVVNSRCILPRAVIKADSNYLFGYLEANAFLISMLSLIFWFVLMSNMLRGSRFCLVTSVSVVLVVSVSFRLVFTLSA